jgi:hypothetical protein
MKSTAEKNRQENKTAILMGQDYGGATSIPENKK